MAAVNRTYLDLLCTRAELIKNETHDIYCETIALKSAQKRRSFEVKAEKVDPDPSRDKNIMTK